MPFSRRRSCTVCSDGKSVKSHPRLANYTITTSALSNLLILPPRRSGNSHVLSPGAVSEHQTHHSFKKRFSFMMPSVADNISRESSRSEGSQPTQKFLPHQSSHFFFFLSPALLVKELRYYARFIVVCLLLEKKKVARELVGELTHITTDYARYLSAVESQEWQLVLQGSFLRFPVSLARTTDVSFGVIC